MPRYWKGDMFELFDRQYSIDKGANAIVVTTNCTRTTPQGGFIRPEKFGVMGRGCALQAAEKWPWFKMEWAGDVQAGRTEGVFARSFRVGGEQFKPNTGIERWVLAMVVKDTWWQNGTKGDADRIVELTEIGLRDLVIWADDHPEINYIIMPFPAIGNAGVPRERIQPMLEQLLDDRFVVCERK